ncbi:MAG: metallophosphoesterase, partial [Clostridia bacterium]|nr:metallophosphoesterase [Clostridia bacterium]
MLASCDALGQLDAPSGVLFVYGNHDTGYYSEAKRGWTGAELRDRLAQNGVTILEDETYDVNDRLCVAGRNDKSKRQRGGRVSAQRLLQGIDKSIYIVVLDHQPNDFDAEAEAGADLVLCGHTHGGQFIPINHVGEWIGENDLRYGHEKRGGTDFIVSSGISNWTFKFRTGCRSEYAVIDILAG